MLFGDTWINNVFGAGFMVVGLWQATWSLVFEPVWIIGLSAFATRAPAAMTRAVVSVPSAIFEVRMDRLETGRRKDCST